MTNSVIPGQTVCSVIRLQIVLHFLWQAKVAEQGAGGGGGWGDASWPGITADLKPPSVATWNNPADLHQMMMTTKKVSHSWLC